MPKALGLVETRGLVAAIEAADAMVKTSNVTLIGKEVTKPALITIKIVGDVAAVKASVDAGAAAAAKVGELVSIHVIPQPDSQMTALFPEIKDDDDPGGGRKSGPREKKETGPGKSSSETKSADAAKASAVDISTKKAEPESGKDSTAAEIPSTVEADEKSAGASGKNKINSGKEISAGDTEDKSVESAAEKSDKPVSAGKTASSKPPVSKPVKPRKTKPAKEQEGENLFPVNTDHLERLRREALGIKESRKEKPANQEIKPASEPSEKDSTPAGKLSMKELEILNVHNLRKAARATEGFPIQGREISRANRRELLDLFKKII